MLVRELPSEMGISKAVLKAPTRLKRKGSCWGWVCEVLAICCAAALHTAGVDPAAVRERSLSDLPSVTSFSKGKESSAEDLIGDQDVVPS